MSDILSWIQAAAAIALAVVTIWTLKVLWEYAADTTKIAQARAQTSES